MLVQSPTQSPPAGAAAVSVTVPVDDVPPATEVGLSDNEDSDAVAGLIVSDAVLFTPLQAAVIVEVVDDVTVVVVTLNVAVVLPADTVTPVGTVAEELLLESATEIPPAGAAALRVTVPVEELPPVTLVGLSDNEDSAAAGVMPSDAVWLAPL